MTLHDPPTTHLVTTLIFPSTTLPLSPPAAQGFFAHAVLPSRNVLSQKTNDWFSLFLQAFTARHIKETYLNSSLTSDIKLLSYFFPIVLSLLTHYMFY